eukprot:766109-Hanusia_phi.AAC.1
MGGEKRQCRCRRGEQRQSTSVAKMRLRKPSRKGSEGSNVKISLVCRANKNENRTTNQEEKQDYDKAMKSATDKNNSKI